MFQIKGYEIGGGIEVKGCYFVSEVAGVWEMSAEET